MDINLLQEATKIMNQAGDELHANHIQELIQKVEARQVVLAFCGHFSAGKSTLINRLCGRAILPSGPIPTSANTVMIYSGEPEAIIYRKGMADSKEELLTIPFGEIDAYCRSGAEVQRMDIRYPIPLLSNHAAFMDTPGIDSTDQAHRQVTESALHLADVVFYVTDYNHVLSDINLRFLKRLEDWGKPIYFVINQIDKHQENELSFVEFKKKVEGTFTAWGIYPLHFFYISLKELQHPLTEWNKLVSGIETIISSGEKWITQSVCCSVRELIKLHLQARKEEHADTVERLMSQMEENPFDYSAEFVREWIVQWKEKLQANGELLLEWDTLAEKKLGAWRKEIFQIIDNAHVIPAQTRDAAQAYLESRRSGFKAGWLASAGKTELVRRDRLAVLCRMFNRDVQTLMQRHVQQALMQTAQSLELDQSPLRDKIEAIDITFEPDWFADHVLESAEVSGEYTLNYSKQLEADAKAIYRRRTTEVLTLMRELYMAQRGDESEALRSQQVKLEQRLGAAQELSEFSSAESGYVYALTQLLVPIGADRYEEAYEGQATVGEGRSASVQEAMKDVGPWVGEDGCDAVESSIGSGAGELSGLPASESSLPMAHGSASLAAAGAAGPR
ncbi:MAG: dynamin family protein, partial [Gorillibacterium sp.]|nr:dynamin family protein [Gorillibacterium sp.]